MNEETKYVVEYWEQQRTQPKTEKEVKQILSWLNGNPKIREVVVKKINEVETDQFAQVLGVTK